MEPTCAQTTPAQIAELVQRRQTMKVLGDVTAKLKLDAQVAGRNDPKVVEAIKVAGWAPFHYDRGVNGIAEPWRAHVLWHQDCQKIAAEFYNWFDDVKPGNKLPSMLSACGALVLVTWLPQFRPGFNAPLAGSEEVAKENQVDIDDEHLAASSAMVQNLLLLLTAHSMGTYWSSGGQFRTRKMLDRLGIGSEESLLAAVFVEYPETMNQPAQRLPGKQRQSRSQRFEWIREVNLSGGKQRSNFD